MQLSFKSAAVVFAFSLGTLGCADEIDNAIDCNGICDRYASCFDANYDVDACAHNCRDSANSDDSYESKVDACESCIDDMSCASSLFNCGDECVDVVP